MSKKVSLYVVLTAMIIAASALTACQPAATAAPAMPAEPADGRSCTMPTKLLPAAEVFISGWYCSADQGRTPLDPGRNQVHGCAECSRLRCGDSLQPG